MTTFSGPNIIENGLILSLDPANRQSIIAQNELYWSKNFSNSSYWANTTYPVIVTDNAAIAPNGKLEAALIAGNSTSPTVFAQTISISDSGTGKKKCSVYAKKGTSDYFTFNCYYVGDTEINLDFNLANGTCSAGATIENVGDGWYLCTIPVPARVGSATSFAYRIWPSGRGVTTTSTYFWGPQMRDHSSPAEYVETNGNQITSFRTIYNMTATSGNGTINNQPEYFTDAKGSLLYTAASLTNISFPSIPEIQFLGNSPYTLEAWVKPTTNPGINNYTGIFDRESNPGSGRNGWNIWFIGSAGTNTSFSTDRFGDGAVYTGASVTVNQSETVNKWNHIVATYDGGTIRLYRNGVVGSSQVSTAQISNTSKTLTIGLRGGQYFTGYIGLTNIYNICLTPAQIKQNFNAMRGRYGI